MKNHIKAIECLCKFHKFIQEKQTGSPDELAERLQISRRTLYNIIDELKEIGVTVKYCRQQRTFSYEGNFDISIKILQISNTEQTEI